MGSFRPDGSWWADGHDNDLTRYVRELLHRRKMFDCSPADLAAGILVSKHASAFNRSVMEQWSHLGRHEDWQHAHSARQIEETIKRAS